MTVASSTFPQPVTRIAAGTPEFKRITRAMIFGGFSTFSLLYSIQPLLPLLALQFQLTPAQSSWALSISTLSLAVSLLISSAISERIGRKPMMVAALALAAVATGLCALTEDFAQLLVLRALLGFALGGMPAVAVAYMGEELEASSMGLAVGLYIAGSAFGGMLGRLQSALLSEYFHWRTAMVAMGLAGIYAAWEFWRSLPAERHFKPAAQVGESLRKGVRLHLADSGLRMLFCLGFILTGCFVSMYNYMGYRLQAAPFGFSQSTAGTIALMYVLGMGSSVWVGRLVDRIGRRGVLWIVLLVMMAGLLLSLSNSLFIMIPGLALYTFGFFAAHSVASSWVARRAQGYKAVASALYLCFYYIGSSLVGSYTGVIWASHGWAGVVMLLGGILGVGLMITLRLRTLLPVVAA
ncbi:MFS transporter [Undibacterium sp. JH2W]|uniref:MFS transporter n=1 Tax=Undibacterium sp. JH2W TaxID=3413037 RepID=UPI003BF1F75E